MMNLAPPKPSASPARPASVAAAAGLVWTACLLSLSPGLGSGGGASPAAFVPLAASGSREHIAAPVGATLELRRGHWKLGAQEGQDFAQITAAAAAATRGSVPLTFAIRAAPDMEYREIQDALTALEAAHVPGMVFQTTSSENP